MKTFQLAEAHFSFKVLVSFFLAAVGVGYVFGLIHIYNDVGFSYTGIVTHYRGEAMPPDFAFAKLIHVQHVHVFGLSMLFFLVGLVFSLTRLPEWFKTILLAMPFLGMFVDMSSFWFLVFMSPVFAWLAMAFGGCMAFSFFLLIGRPLYEMWVLPLWARVWKTGDIPWFLR